MFSLFNNTESGITEFRSHIPALDAKVSYSKIQAFVDRKAIEVRTEIGSEMYDTAHAHYISSDYNLPDQSSEKLLILDKLVYLYLLFVILLSCHS